MATVLPAKNAANANASTSSEPLPQNIQSAGTPSTALMASRKAVASMSGYRRRDAASNERSTSATRGDGGYGFSFVLSLINLRFFGCSPAT